MKKKVLFILMVFVNVGIFVMVYLIWNAIFIQKNADALPLYLIGLSVFSGFLSVLSFTKTMKKK